MRSDIDAEPFTVAFAPVPPAEYIAALLRTGFSPEAYRDVYGDFPPGMTPAQALGHYINNGIRERRSAPMVLDRQALVELARYRLHDQQTRGLLLSSLGYHLFEDVAHPYGAAIAERWADIRALMQEGGRPYFVAGDHHSHQIALLGERNGEWLLPIHLICGSSSACGLIDPASRSGYGGHLRHAERRLKQLPGADRVPFLLQFGQVDIEFVHHFLQVRAEEKQLDLASYRAFCAETVERYVQFACAMFEASRRSNVFLVSIFPPVLSDAAWREGHVNGDIANREAMMQLRELSPEVRGLDVANLRQRTEIHAFFNECLRAACREHGFRFFDTFTAMLGPGGVAHPRFVTPPQRGAEHYLDPRRTYDVLVDRVWMLLDSCHAAEALAPTGN